MSTYSRRRFLSQVAAGCALPSLGGWAAPRARPRIDLERMAAELTACSREAAFSTAVGFVRAGAAWSEVLGATLLVGAREVRPQPMGNDAHSIMMVESAFQLAEQTAPQSRPYPVLFNLDYVKRSQSRDGGWRIGADSAAARGPVADPVQLLEHGMLHWDRASAYDAVSQLFPGASTEEVFELLWPFALRDFRFLGHKPIFAAALYRSLHRVGSEHARLLLRSLVLGLLDGGGANEAWTATHVSNGKLARTLGHDRRNEQADPAASMALAERLRVVSVDDAGPMVVELLGAGVSRASIWDGLRLYAAEVLMQERGIAGVHLTTSINALHFIGRTTSRAHTRNLALLQAASWMALFRDDFTKERDIRLDGPGIDELESADGARVEDILAVDERGRASAARQAMRMPGTDELPLFEESLRQHVFTKGDETHAYKYLAAMLEEVHFAHPEVARRVLAAGAFYLPVGGSEDAGLNARIRRALADFGR